MAVAARARSAIYDALIVGMTARWYRAVLERLPRGCRLLDVGIGTGAALIANAELLRANDIHVTGLDIDRAYVERCRAAIAQSILQNRIEVCLESIDTHDAGPYDAVYFSGSFMLLPDPVATLRRVRSLLRPDGLVWFTQTFERRRSRAIERLKPMLRRVTSIDFGRVIYEADFRATLAAAGFEPLELRELRPGKRRTAVLAVARP
jgi:SAM-dependent methyltransferase